MFSFLTHQMATNGTCLFHVHITGCTLQNKYQNRTEHGKKVCTARYYLNVNKFILLYILAYKLSHV